MFVCVTMHYRPPLALPCSLLNLHHTLFIWDSLCAPCKGTSRSPIPLSTSVWGGMWDRNGGFRGVKSSELPCPRLQPPRVGDKEESRKGGCAEGSKQLQRSPRGSWTKTLGTPGSPSSPSPPLRWCGWGREWQSTSGSLPQGLWQPLTCPQGPYVGGCCVAHGQSGAPAASAHSASLSPTAQWTVNNMWKEVGKRGCVSKKAQGVLSAWGRNGAAPPTVPNNLSFLVKNPALQAGPAGKSSTAEPHSRPNPIFCLPLLLRPGCGCRAQAGLVRITLLPQPPMCHANPPHPSLTSSPCLPSQCEQRPLPLCGSALRSR